MAFVTALPSAQLRSASTLRCSSKAVRVSAFRGARVAAPTQAVTRSSPRMGFEISEGVEFDNNPAVLGLALVGWIIPSSLPANIPLTGNTGLTQAFFSSMNSNLANFPKGPGLDDPFWTLCFMWHVGMFACLIFGTIGFNMRKTESS